MKYSLILALVLTACGDTGCEFERYQERRNGELWTCTRDRCPGFPDEVRCSKY